MPLNYIEVLHDSCLHTAWHGVCEPIVHTSTSCACPFPPSPRRLEDKANWLTDMDKLVLCFVPLVAALGRAAQHERLTACPCAKLVRAAAVAVYICSCEESHERHVVLLPACFRKFNAIDFDEKRAFRVQHGDSLIRAFVIVGL